MQRGFQVYNEVCAGCHSMKLIAFRNFADLGYNEAEIKALAAQYEVQDGPNDDGEMFMRPAIPADRMPSPYANDNAARAGNNGALPPDLSLIAKARPNGPNYLYSLLSSYENAPNDKEVPDGMYYNAAYPGRLIAMPQPLYGDDVEYSDGAPSIELYPRISLSSHVGCRAKDGGAQTHRRGCCFFPGYFCDLLVPSKTPNLGRCSLNTPRK